MAAYKIAFRKRAYKEYIETISWYKERSLQASENFVTIVGNILISIAEFPYSYRNNYKHFYEIKTKRFPFTIIYFIDENKKLIVITTIFHQKRNPLRKYR